MSLSDILYRIHSIDSLNRGHNLIIKLNICITRHNIYIKIN